MLDNISDMFVFFLFWELELIPAYFLIGGDFTVDYSEENKKSNVKIGSGLKHVNYEIKIHLFSNIPFGIKRFLPER